MRINNCRWAALAVAALMALPGLADGDGLHDAADNGDVEKVRALLDAGANVNARNNYGETALMRTALNGHAEVAALLIDAGADVDAKDDYGGTALMWAAWRGNAEEVKLLIDAGADVDAKNDDGRTALVERPCGGSGAADRSGR